ncbi:MAG: DCL family protein, partial [Bradyrhizobium sp.]|nr:DCL family protein [Bradyrhizobium sp.]
MAKSVSLPNGRFWKAQTAALDHFKNMLRRHVDEQTVEDYLDHDDLVALLERYDAVIVDAPAKIGRGIDYFFRRQNVGEGFSTPGFWVRRIDGSETDFSYIQA